jgi:diguanylate cyclase (GGDEF)-like protein
VEALSAIFRNLGNSLDLDNVFATLDRELRRLVNYDTIAIYVADSAELTLAYAAGGELAWLQSSAGEELLAEAVGQNRPAVRHIPDDFVPQCSHAAESVMIYPIAQSTSNGCRMIAVLALHSPASFSAADIDILRAIAPKVSASIGNARQYQEAAALAEADSQTGLANARSLFKRLDAELARAARSDTSLAILQCSIEGIDQSGRFCSPAAARRVFETLARKLKESCREYDFAARSGDELVLVLPGFRRQFLEDKRTAIRRMVEEAGLRAGLPIFAVIGDAFFPGEGKDAEDLLTIAARKVAAARLQAKYC